MRERNYSNIILENYNTGVYVYRLNNKIYYKTKKMKMPVRITGESVRKLKEMIKFPIKINFRAVSRAQMGRIVSLLKGDQVMAFRKLYWEKLNKDTKLQCFDVLLITEDEINSISKQKKKIK